MSDCDDLLRMFQSITTTDHDALIAQFGKLLALEPKTSAFFLESSNWNVETAVNMYLATTPAPIEDELPVLPDAKFLSDLSAAQNAVFLPHQQITLHLIFQNHGPVAWPANTRLAFYQGVPFGAGNDVHIGAIPVGEHTQIDMVTTLPGESGTHYGTWRLMSDGLAFGDPVWVLLSVADEHAKDLRMDTGDHAMEVDDEMDVTSHAYHDHMQPDMEL
ncbi:hypothetical protein SDRG_06719 [Saprolegnia diclina VS20]|uniref:Nbr1 FW domain-containing protein n=1 Tax=Saprolegnia diclina (strain VS20) TaxID=1156394 RepID=T0S070_SAPDV|nr:hypothetical protein SDRG_06719 [Saprolegnia diclina VS20]EQC35977.1 hypothetical protein SDRG_06719 [Saprolegnia diclina VS20]|eukprot:XP_008610739.1 hypothetical protein SDRG_06719 [Saprolegnia diclina VS20]